MKRRNPASAPKSALLAYGSKKGSRSGDPSVFLHGMSNGSDRFFLVSASGKRTEFKPVQEEDAWAFFNSLTSAGSRFIDQEKVSGFSSSLRGNLAPKFKVGDTVTYVNDQGVSFPGKTVTRVEVTPYDYDLGTNKHFRYMYAPKDSSWVTVPESNLRLARRNNGAPRRNPDAETIQQRMKRKLEQIGLPFMEIKVYGSQIVVICKSLDTANKWAGVLSKFSKVRAVVPHMEKAKSKPTGPGRGQKFIGCWLVGAYIA